MKNRGVLRPGDAGELEQFPARLAELDSYIASLDGQTVSAGGGG